MRTRRSFFWNIDGTGSAAVACGKNRCAFPAIWWKRSGILTSADGVAPARGAYCAKPARQPLPEARKLAESELTREDLDSTRVRVEGKLLGWHMEQGAPVLEMQSGAHLYLARLAPGNSMGALPARRQPAVL